MGQRGWQHIERMFVKWIKRNGCPAHKLIRTTKPIGNGICLLLVAHAHALEDLINEKARTRELDDSEFADSDGDEESDHDTDDSNGSGDEEELSDIGEAWFSATITRPPADLAPRCHTCHADPSSRSLCMQGAGLADRISHILDPETIRLREEERSNHALQQTQLFYMTQELHDSKSLCETLHSQLAELRECLQHTEHALDHAELRLQIADLNTGMPSGSTDRTSHADIHDLSPYFHRYTEHHPPVDYRTRNKRKQCFTVEYPEGGGYIRFVSDPSTTEDYAWPPHPRSSTRSPTPPHVFPWSSWQPQPEPGPSHVQDEDAVMQDAPGVFSNDTAVELTVTPHHSHPISLQIGPSQPSRASVINVGDDSGDDELISNWSPSPACN
ncbi:hypothetical protein EWM64_g5111 [Hericium alpestre]|uniref:Cytochrome c domain-containing protein n=1 Tax=Hericium alpestre TaxID=135208 RepID=A0A4Y9ZZM6_9AGAM|nr:hypothetical protein EWM64_g5111 [Hericium alpestre]